jgi:hypothetical protein
LESGSVEALCAFLKLQEIPVPLPSSEKVLSYLPKNVFKIKQIDKATATFGAILDLAEFPVDVTTEKRVYSTEFTVGSADWRILFLRSGGSGTIGVFVECMQVTRGPPGFKSLTSFRFVCVNQLDRGRDLSNRDKFQFVYDNKGEKDRGFHNFINISSVNDISNGYCYSHPSLTKGNALEIHICLRDWSVFTNAAGEIPREPGTCILSAYPFSLHLPWLLTLYNTAAFRRHVLSPNFQTDHRPWCLTLQTLFAQIGASTTDVDCRAITSMMGWDQHGTSYSVTELLHILFKRIGEVPGCRVTVRTIPTTCNNIESVCTSLEECDILVIDLQRFERGCVAEEYGKSTGAVSVRRVVYPLELKTTSGNYTLYSTCCSDLIHSCYVRRGLWDKASGSEWILYGKSVVNAHQVEAVQDNYGGGDLFWIDPQRTANVLFYVRDVQATLRMEEVSGSTKEPVSMTTVQVLHISRIAAMDCSNTAEEILADLGCSTVPVRVASPVQMEALAAALPPTPGGYIFSRSILRGVPEAPFLDGGGVAIATPVLKIEGPAANAPTPSPEKKPVTWLKKKDDKKEKSPQREEPPIALPESHIMVWQYLPTLALCQVFACVVGDVMVVTPRAIHAAITKALGSGAPDITVYIGDPQGKQARLFEPVEMETALGTARSVVYFQHAAPPGARVLYPTVVDYVKRDTHAMAMTTRIAAALK